MDTLPDNAEPMKLEHRRAYAHVILTVALDESAMPFRPAECCRRE
jgi:hypothetical protein